MAAAETGKSLLVLLVLSLLEQPYSSLHRAVNRDQVGVRPGRIMKEDTERSEPEVVMNKNERIKSSLFDFLQSHLTELKEE